MWHRSRGFRNGGGNASIGPGFARVQLSYADHHLRDQDTFIPGGCRKQRADGGRPSTTKRELALSLEFGDEGSQFGLVVGEFLMYRRFPG